MTSSSSAATTRRRKIFPHLEDEKRSAASASNNEAGSGVGRVTNDNDDGTSKMDDSKSTSYNNDKSKVESSASAVAASRKKTDKQFIRNESTIPISHHLLPLPLVLTVLVCSGLFWIASFRDVMATGKPILDTLSMIWGQEDADSQFLQYTKSPAWFDDSRGWKSKQGGLSTILSVTTDANNMGGLFIRKMSGVAGLAYHTTKMWPIVFHSPPQYDTKSKSGRWVGASWSAGHFDPLLTLGMIGDVCISIFYMNRMDDLTNAGARRIGMAFVYASLIEAFIIGIYLLSRRMNHKASASTTRKGNANTDQYNPDEDPNSLPSRIVARTVLIVSSLTSLVSLRDLFFPGNIISFIPRDDIYLEWTGAFLHSPPPDTVEADENGLEAPLFEGDKFVSQLLGLYLSLCCMLKVMSAMGWSKGDRNLGGVVNVERSGVVSSRMIWKAQAFGNTLVLGMLRLFTPAALTASLDLRWHLMLVAYEAFILFLYGFW